MKQLQWILPLAALLMVGELVSISRAEEKGKGTEVALDDLKSTTPADWVNEKPSSRLRYKQFKLPKAEGDSADAVIVIFKGFGGTAKQNIDRWKQQFKAPPGKKLEDVSKVAEVKIGGREAARLDIEGIFLDRPFPRSPKVTPRPDYQMVALQIDAPLNIYHVKFYGPKKTVQKYLKGFNGWLEGFKK